MSGATPLYAVHIASDKEVESEPPDVGFAPTRFQKKLYIVIEHSYIGRLSHFMY